ncbi:MAG: hypothetical protein ACK5Q5_13280 [Planctomycetaceae bacterium]
MSPDFDGPDFEEHWDRLRQQGDVPRPFFSEYLSTPFVRCIDCEADLIATDEAYSVVKSYVAGETIFEMAICSRCSIRLAQGYSAHSKAMFEAAMREWKRQTASSAEAPTEESEERSFRFPVAAGQIDQIEACASCGRPRVECHRYSIVGAFLGRSMVTPTDTPFRLPLMICDRCNSRTTENISQQTRDNWDRFVEDHFDGPPGIELDSPQLDPILI